MENESCNVTSVHKEWKMYHGNVVWNGIPNDLREYDGRMERALNFNRSSSEKQARLMMGGVWGSSAPSSFHTLSEQLSW